MSIASLTGIRGLAAVWVLLFHMQAGATLLRLPWLGKVPVLGAGWLGVDLFFVLSGFILMHAHARDFETLSKASITRFAKLRIARVYPLSLVVLVAIAGALALEPRFQNEFRKLADGNMSLLAFAETACLATRWFLPGSGDWNQPVWSLSAEMIGYAAFPLLAWRLVRCRSFWTPLALALLSLACLDAIRVMMGSVDDNIIQSGGVMRMAFCFVSGAAFSRAKAVAPSWVDRRAAPISIAAASAMLVTAMLPHPALLMPAVFAVLVFTLSFSRGHIHRALASPVALFFGRISFPLYLIHVMPLLYLQYRIPRSSLSGIASLALVLGYLLGCLVVAYALHRLVEKPSQKFGRIWASKRALVDLAYSGALGNPV